MKTTIDLPEPLLRQAKAEAALRGLKLRELVQSGIEMFMSQSASTTPERPSAFELLQGGCGVVESGIGDLASNPKHLEGFGSK